MNRLVTAILLTTFIGSGSMLSSCENKRETQKETSVKTEKEIKNEEIVAAPETLNPELEQMEDTTASKSANTSSQKFGHINSADLIQLMPETKKADAALAAYVKTLENQFSSMQGDYQKKIGEFQGQEKSMLENVRQTKIKAIQDLEMKLQETQAASREKVADKREALYKPILEKAEKAVKAVGKENGYDYVFDTNAGSFIYAKDSHDIMPLVKAKLGLK